MEKWYKRHALSSTRFWCPDFNRRAVVGGTNPRGFSYCLGHLYCWIQYFVFSVQLNPSSEATPFAPEMWPFKKGGLLLGVEINKLMVRLSWSSDLSRGVGLWSGWPLGGGSVELHLVWCEWFLNRKYLIFQ